MINVGKTMAQGFQIWTPYICNVNNLIFTRGYAANVYAKKFYIYNWYW